MFTADSGSQQAHNQAPCLHVYLYSPRCSPKYRDTGGARYMCTEWIVYTYSTHQIGTVIKYLCWEMNTLKRCIQGTLCSQAAPKRECVGEKYVNKELQYNAIHASIYQMLRPSRLSTGPKGGVISHTDMRGESTPGQP